MIKKLTSKQYGFSAVRRAMTLLVAAIVITAVGLATTSQVSYAADVNCYSIGSGRYNCNFYTTTSVVSHAGVEVGKNYAGNNWVICQLQGKTVSVGSDANYWWAYTMAENGKMGWVNAVYASSGTNFGRYGAVPNCGSQYGLPPGVTATASDCSGENKTWIAGQEFMNSPGTMCFTVQNDRFSFDANGNVVLYYIDAAGNWANGWSTHTAGKGKLLRFWKDGNVILYDANGGVLWQIGAHTASGQPYFRLAFTESEDAYGGVNGGSKEYLSELRSSSSSFSSYVETWASPAFNSY